jgi:glycosyltransferase involved in cell wall biosynthesis
VASSAPDARLCVVGKNPPPSISKLDGQNNVTVTGYVDDTRDYIARSRVFIVPLRVGSGMRVKILQAMAMGKAVVSTTVGAEGLALTPGREYVAADDPRAFAGAVVSLLRDSRRRRALGQAGRRLVEERYSWAQVAGEFESLCLQAVADHEESRTAA